MRKILILFLFIVIFFYIYGEENIKIAICPPFKKNNNSFTVFYNRQFLFEFLANYENENYKIEIINPKDFTSENEYYEKCIDIVYENSMDYLIFSTVYSIAGHIVFKVMLFDPYNEDIIFNKIFTQKEEFFLNEQLALIVSQLKDSINRFSLKKTHKKLIIKTEKKEEEKDLFVLNNKDVFKHEISIQNGFFKIQPKIMTFLSWYIGYNFTPFKFLKIEANIFLGAGGIEKKFDFNNLNYFNYFFIGTYGAFYFFLSGFFIEPFAGVKTEFSYIVNDFVYFYIPIDFGLRIFVSKRDCIRIDTNFQFSALNINNGVWENFFLIGFLLGYARKI